MGTILGMRILGPILPRTHRAQRKFLCSCYQPYALVGPPGFALFTMYIHVIRPYAYLPKLTYLLTYLLTCAIVCALVCLFVCLFLLLF